MEQLQTENSAAGGLSDLTDVLGFPPVLDACCGSRMFWFNKQDERAIFVDKRSDVFDIAPDKAYPNGSRIVVRPDRQADFTDLPFPDDTFALVVFDPPHLTRVGDSSLLAKKYGKLTGEWQEMIRGGFAECFRVLRPEGVLIFKWADSDHSLSSILSLTNHKPLFGHKTRQHAKTHWVTFMKPNQEVDIESKDPVIEQLVAELRRRSAVGLQKYGKPLSRDDLKLIDWLRHALEETLDNAGYLQAAINSLESGHLPAATNQQANK